MLPQGTIMFDKCMLQVVSDADLPCTASQARPGALSAERVRLHDSDAEKVLFSRMMSAKCATSRNIGERGGAASGV